jgi:hypothetical protein
MMRQLRRLNPEIAFKEDRDFDISLDIVYWYLNYPATKHCVFKKKFLRKTYRTMMREVIVLHDVENMISEGLSHLTGPGQFLRF